MSKKILAVFLSITLFWNCNNTSNNHSNMLPKKTEETTLPADTVDAEDTSPIENISLLYYNYINQGVEELYPSDISLHVPPFTANQYKGVLDAEITDPQVLSEIDSLLKQLHPDPLMANNWDTRITGVIKYRDGTKADIAINGEYTDVLCLNQIPQQTNNRLLYLIKNSIGFYPWIIGDDLLEMKELNDHSFQKEPFLSSKYYKMWQKAKPEN